VLVRFTIYRFDPAHPYFILVFGICTRYLSFGFCPLLILKIAI